MSQYKIMYTVKAQNDLKEIAEYLYKLTLNKVLTKRKIRTIKTEIQSLSLFPDKCPICEIVPFKGKGLRFMTVENYNVLYQKDEKSETIRVIRIYFGRKDPNSIVIE